MKRSELLKQIKKEGCIFYRPESRHDIYINPKNNLFQDTQKLIMTWLSILRNIWELQNKRFINLVWLAIANEVRTAILSSDKIIFIPE